MDAGEDRPQAPSGAASAPVQTSLSRHASLPAATPVVRSAALERRLRQRRQEARIRARLACDGAILQCHQRPSAPAPPPSSRTSLGAGPSPRPRSRPSCPRPALPPTCWPRPWPLAQAPSPGPGPASTNPTPACARPGLCPNFLALALTLVFGPWPPQALRGQDPGPGPRPCPTFDLPHGWPTIISVPALDSACGLPPLPLPAVQMPHAAAACPHMLRTRPSSSCLTLRWPHT